MRFGASSTARVVATLTLSGAALLPALAQQADRPVADLEGLGLDQRLDAPLPLGLTFRDETGRQIELRDYFDGEKPVLLSLAYYRCPMLCTLVLDGMVDALREIDWEPGREFEIVTLSIDPREGVELARQKKQSYARAYGRAGAAEGWHFLTGEGASIAELAEAVGFRYRFLEDSGEFAHPAALFVITPEGRVSRYLLGVRHEPRTLRLSLVEAGAGRIGSVVDQFLLYCYRYDAATGRYTPVAWRLMRLGGIVTVLLLAGALVVFWRAELRQRRPA